MKKTAIFFLSILPLVLAFPALGFKPPELEKLKTTKVCLGCDLSSSSLQEAQLAGADLSGSNLSRSNLNGADLTGANLTGVNYQQTYFEGATWSNGETCKKGSFGKCVTETFERLLATKTCRDCSLPYAMLVDTYLQGAFLRGVDFKGAITLSSVHNAPVASSNQAKSGAPSGVAASIAQEFARARAALESAIATSGTPGAARLALPTPAVGATTLIKFAAVAIRLNVSVSSCTPNK